MNYSRLTAMAEAASARRAVAHPDRLLHRIAVVAAHRDQLDRTPMRLRIRGRRTDQAPDPGASPRPRPCEAGDTASA